MVERFHGSRSMALLISFIFTLSIHFLTSSISAGEMEGPFLIDQALESIGMKRGDISIRGDLFESPHTLNSFKRWMEDPIKAPREAQEMARELIRSADDPFMWLKVMARIGEINHSEPLPLIHYSDYKIPVQIKRDLRRAIIILLDAIYTAHLKLQSIKKSIEPDKIKLIEKCLVPDFAQYRSGIINMFRRKELKEAIHIAGMVDRKAIIEAALSVSKAIKEALKILKGKENNYKSLKSFSFQTSIGKVEIGSLGSDIHQGDAILIIDLGGNDLYRGRVASGINGVCSVVIDIQGNDTYLGDGLTQGFGLWGIGILYDLEGDDFYHGGDLSQGTGIFGLGLIIDGSGSDTYSGGKFVQASSSFGWGGLIDISGEDIYQCKNSGQAFSGIGGISSLCDIKGNDKYLSGLDSPDPREQDMNQSLSQGFAKGIPNFGSGGFAILVDGEGNDIYQCQYFGQGASYWMGVGCLYDDSGNDLYIARRYAQGSGIHFSFGILLDSGGDDHMVSWGASQGFGYDYGIGIIINESGNDKYISDWLSIGASDENGVGIFVDNSGDDGYFTRTGIGACYFSDKRRPGGLGIFIDAKGLDRYSNKGKENTFWGSNRWEIGIDGYGGNQSGLSILPSLETKSLRDEAQKKKETERMNLLKLLSLAEGFHEHERIEAILHVASHWGIEKEIPKWAKEKLKNEPMRSIPILVDLLSCADTLNLEVMDEVFRSNPQYALPELLKKAKDLDPTVRSRVFQFLSRIPDQKAVKICIDALKDPSWRVRASSITALGNILQKMRIDKEEISNQIPQLLMEFLHDRYPDVRGAAVYSLAQMGYSDAIPHIIGLLQDSDRGVRDRASMALLLFEEEAIGHIEEVLKKGPSSLKIISIDILTRMKGERARSIVERYLNDPDANIRRVANRYRD